MKCKIEDCNKEAAKARYGMCFMHYMRYYRYGRSHNKINRGSGYWINAQNYLVLLIDGKEIYEHRYVAERALGKPLPANACIHHIDGNSLNNEPNNLVICPDHSYHMLLHSRAKELGYENNQDT